MSQHPLTYVVRGWRESLEKRELLVTDDQARAERFLRRLRAKFLGLTDYELISIPKRDETP